MDLAFSQTVITTIGWSLIHFLWQGTLITLVYWLITRSIKSIHAKYWTGISLVIVSLCIPIINSFRFNEITITPELTAFAPKNVVSYQLLNAENLFYYLIETALPYFVMMWGLTVMFLSFRVFKSWLALANIKHECDPKVSSQLKQFVKNIAIKLDLPTIPMLKVSKDVLVPAAYGVFKPTILLPLSLIGKIPTEQLEAIIKHELCHLKRNDFIHNIIQLCADILLFFHPGIRWMNNDIRHIREQCCDQMVLAQQTEAITYAKALTNIATFTNQLNLKHSVHLGINDGMLLNRVKFLLQNKSSQSSLILFMPIIMLVLLTMFLLQPKLNEAENFKTSTINQSITQAEIGNKQYMPFRNLSGQNFYPSKEHDQSQGPKSENTLRNKVPVYQPGSNINNLNQEILSEIETNLLNKENFTTLEQNPIIKFEVIKRDEIETTNIEMSSDEIPPITKTEQEATIERNSFTEINSMPSLSRYIAPVYPLNYWYNQVEQDVIATFKIKPNGRVYDINIKSQKNQFVGFEQEVEKALKRWKFEPESLSHSTLQRTYQQMFSFAISEEVEKNCEVSHTGTRLKKPMPCNK
ncbi:MAG: M56 family metallopeptidase [Marinicella sp.]